MWYPSALSSSGKLGIVSSQTAPCRIAPSPVRQKYWPESNELLHGVHDGAVTWAFLNNTPSRAIRSKLGVAMTSLENPARRSRRRR